MEIDTETLKAIIAELQLFRLAETKYPDTLAWHIKDCACLGPIPECRCAKRERLVSAFIKMDRIQVG